MKYIQIILYSTLLVFLTSCGSGPEPLNPKNTYSVENLTDADMVAHYTILAHHSFPRKDFTDSCHVSANTITNLPLDKYGFYVSNYPSELFERIVFLSTNGDTLRILYPIEDSAWEDSISISDYGYKVGNHHWLYKFSN